MAQLRHQYADLLARDAEVLVVAPDSPDALRRYWEKEALPFPGLADPDHAVADRYRQQVKILKFGRLPAVFIVDRQGQIRAQHYGRSMSDIPTIEAVIALLGSITSGVAPVLTDD